MRGYHDRILADPTVARTVKEFATQLPIAFEVYTDLSKRKVRMLDDRRRQQKREMRTAQLVFSAGAVKLRRPSHVEKNLPSELELNVVQVREVNAPEGVEPVDWTLFTTEPIDKDSQISRVVDFYRARWVIEEFFKALKTGCAFEKRQLESMHTLEDALALFLPIAWGLLRLRTLARDYPDLPAASVLEPAELTVLRRMKLLPPRARITAREALLAVAQLGGSPKNNAEPGWIVLGRGYRELLTLAAGFGSPSKTGINHERQRGCWLYLRITVPSSAQRRRGHHAVATLVGGGHRQSPARSIKKAGMECSRISFAQM